MENSTCNTTIIGGTLRACLLSCYYHFLYFSEIRQCYFGVQPKRNGNNADLSSSSGALHDAKPHDVSGVYRISAPPPFQLPQCLDSDYGRSTRGGQQNDSSGDTRSPLPVSLDSEPLDKGMCFANPANVSVIQPCPIRLRVRLSC